MKKTIRLLLLICILSLSFVFISCNKNKVYAASTYNIVVISNQGGVVGDNIIQDLSEFEYYNLVFSKKNNTFVLSYKKVVEKNPQTFNGTYVETSDSISITYTDTYFDETLSKPVYTKSDDGKTLTRSEKVFDAEGIFLYRIDQVFKLK